MEKPVRVFVGWQICQSEILVSDKAIAFCSKGERVTKQPIGKRSENCGNKVVIYWLRAGLFSRFFLNTSVFFFFLRKKGIITVSFFFL